MCLANPFSIRRLKRSHLKKVRGLRCTLRRYWNILPCLGTKGKPDTCFHAATQPPGLRTVGSKSCSKRTVWLFGVSHARRQPAHREQLGLGVLLSHTSTLVEEPGIELATFRLPINRSLPPETLPPIPYVSHLGFIYLWTFTHIRPPTNTPQLFCGASCETLGSALRMSTHLSQSLQYSVSPLYMLANHVLPCRRSKFSGIGPRLPPVDLTCMKAPGLLCRSRHEYASMQWLLTADPSTVVL